MSNNLEDLVDEYGLSDVLRKLSDICGEKADHLRTNWQDSTSADRWDKAYILLNTLAERVKGI